MLYVLANGIRLRDSPIPGTCTQNHVLIGVEKLGFFYFSTQNPFKRLYWSCSFKEAHVNSDTTVH